MEKVFDFGKIDLNGCGRKVNKVEVTVELTDDGVFTASALVWNSKHTDCEIGGQCLDEIAEFIKDNEIFNKIYKYWKLYHLNDMHPGTKAQEDALHEAGIENWANEYYKVCEYLESVGLLFDNGYKFGTGWLKYDIPEDDLMDIKNLLMKGSD